MEKYDYKPNSHAYKNKQNEESEEQKKIEKVVSGGVKTKKKNEIQKFAGNLISDDAGNVKSYLKTEVFIPAIKDLLEDLVIKGIRVILRGETGARSGSSGTKVAYGSFFGKDTTRRATDSPRARTGFDYDDFIIENRGEAEAVLDQMDEVINRYGFVAVSDLYDMLDQTAPYTSNKYGWTDLRTAKVVPVRGGYMLKLPKAFPLD